MCEFAAPTSLQATGIDVQDGDTQRSYIRNVDVVFDDISGLQDLIDNNRIEVERFDLNNATPTQGTGTAITGFSAATNANQIQLDFGADGIGGVGHAGNGFYRIAIDMDGDGGFDDAIFEFFRLYGDADGDGTVGRNDRRVLEDLTGDGLINSADRRLYRAEARRRDKLHDDLFAELDD